MNRVSVGLSLSELQSGYSYHTFNSLEITNYIKCQSLCPLHLDTHSNWLLCTKCSAPVTDLKEHLVQSHSWNNMDDLAIVEKLHCMIQDTLPVRITAASFIEKTRGAIDGLLISDGFCCTLCCHVFSDKRHHCDRGNSCRCTGSSSDMTPCKFQILKTGKPGSGPQNMRFKVSAEPEQVDVIVDFFAQAQNISTDTASTASSETENRVFSDNYTGKLVPYKLIQAGDLCLRLLRMMKYISYMGVSGSPGRFHKRMTYSVLGGSLQFN